ncbi:hypothetical protein PC123_g17265 [Phytophthora cactorum]|nr:hypothetical protein PC123_g17265 [Phytophthora cactorum]
MTHSNTAEMKAKTLTWRRDRTSKTLESIEAKTNKYCEAATHNTVFLVSSYWRSITTDVRVFCLLLWL